VISKQGTTNPYGFIANPQAAAGEERSFGGRWPDPRGDRFLIDALVNELLD